MREKKSLSILFVFLVFLVFSGCADDATEETEVILELAEIELTNPGAVLVNPACVLTSMNELLEQVDDWDYYEDNLEKIKVDEVQFQVTANNTPSAIDLWFQMSDPEMIGTLVDIGSDSLLASTSVLNWMELPFDDGAEEVIDYYLDDRDQYFQYCAYGEPPEDLVEMTVWFRLVLVVTTSL